MVNNIVKEIKKKNYLELSSNIGFINVLYAGNDLGCNVIVLLDHAQQEHLTIEQYNHILDQIYNQFLTRGYSRINLLSIICTDQVSSVREFCQKDRFTHWIIDTLNSKLIVFENQGTLFHDMREYMRDIVEGPFVANQSREANRSSEVSKTRKGHNNYSKILKKWPVCTVVLVLINVIVYILVELSGSSLDTEHMIDWGASYYEGIVNDHQYYRLLTCMFLHFGVEHLINNMFMLVLLGERLEYIAGRVKLLIIYFGAGILSSVCSLGYYYYKGENLIVSAGASGAIFSLLGGILALVVINRGKLRDLTAQRIVFFLFLSLYSGVQAGDVDNAAHIAGFIAGFIITVILCRKKEKVI